MATKQTQRHASQLKPVQVRQLLGRIPDDFSGGVNVTGSAAHLDSGQAVDKGEGFVELQVDDELAALVHETPPSRLADLRQALGK